MFYKIKIQFDSEKMHMADALVSPAVAGAAAAVSVTLLAISARKVKRAESENLIPLMGVMGAFVFAAQMINFTIPGTGSSGHIVGGILLGALLGPWAAFLTLASVLVVQCLIFADGGLMALGCNLLNMGVCSTLIAYPFVYRPIAGDSTHNWRVIAGAIAASVVGLELGALLVTTETELSGVTALPTGKFLALMSSIHLFIGIGEGIATAAVLYFVKQYQPSLLAGYRSATGGKTGGYKKAALIFLGIAAVFGIAFTWIASSYPDGLEWSIENIAGDNGLPEAAGTIADKIAGVQQSTSFLPDYSSTWSGIIGCTIVVALVWIVCTIFTRKARRVKSN